MKKNLLFLLLIFFTHFVFSQQKQPNILWIVCEDISPTLSFYGDPTAKTPNLDALAAESLVYKNAFAVVGVCAPSRSSIITGMYPTSIGTMHMRTGKDIISWGKRTYDSNVPINDIEGKPIQEYSAVISAEVKCFPEYLRAAGYYCTNNDKTDYQFAAPVTAWDENNSHAHWKNRNEGQAFFSVFNFNETHESKLWKYSDKPLTVNPNKVIIPPYFPDNKSTRETIARHYSNIEILDQKIGKLLDELKADGLYENTIIFFYSDHGGPLPRQKRAIYNSGLQVPFMIKGVGKTGTTDRMISFVDLAPTMLSLAGIEPPVYMQGKAFLGEFITQPREYIYGSSDRFDEVTDRIRAVRGQRYLYLKNYYPQKPGYKNLSYRLNVPMMKDFIDLRNHGELNKIQQQWFHSKPQEELYDTQTDPYNINNLAHNSDHQQVLERFRNEYQNFLYQYPDLGQIPESQLIQTMWPKGEQPETQKVTVHQQGNRIKLESLTPGASIAYLIVDEKIEDLNFDLKWKLYTEPIEIENGKILYALAQRIGYRESKKIHIQL